MLKLYKKFIQLDVNNRGVLTNKEFLELPELKYTPFRPRLIDGFQLKTDDDVRAIRVIRQDSLAVEDIDGKARGRNEDAKDNGNDATNYPDEKSRVPSKGNSKIVPFGEDKKDNAAEEEEDNLKTEEDDAKFLKRLGNEPYIRFADFSKYLSLFNQRTGLDEKI